LSPLHPLSSASKKKVEHQTSFDVLIGHIGTEAPLIYVPRKDGKGRYASWQEIQFSSNDRDSAAHISWLLSGMFELSDGVDDSNPRWGVVHDEAENFMYTLVLRAAFLMNTYHLEPLY
jgi:hypothetical protein